MLNAGEGEMLAHQDRMILESAELLAIGIVVMVWEEKTSITRNPMGYCVNRPNGFKLKASDWEPDLQLLNHFSDHPVVRMYHRGEPVLRAWFRKSGKVSQCLISK